jgi:hypothetical protein
VEVRVLSWAPLEKISFDMFVVLALAPSPWT